MEKASAKMRDLVIAVGGPIGALENRKSWLARVADRAGLSVRVVKAAFYEEQLSAATKLKLKQAAGAHEAENLAVQFDHLAQSIRLRGEDRDRKDVAALLHAARALRGLAGPRDDEG